MISASPEMIVAKLLVDLGVGYVPKPTEKRPWVVVFATEPDSPDLAITVKNTQGRMFGRTIEDGETQENPGVQILVRGRTAIEANLKARTIAEKLDKNVTMITVEVDLGDGTVENVLVHAIQRTSSLIPLRQEEKNNRKTVSLNAVVTFTEP